MCERSHHQCRDTHHAMNEDYEGGNKEDEDDDGEEEEEEEEGGGVGVRETEHTREHHAPSSALDGHLLWGRWGSSNVKNTG